MACTLAAVTAWAQPIGGKPKLDPVTRTRLMAALLAIIIMGIALIVLVILGAHMVRRRARMRVDRRLDTRATPKITLAEIDRMLTSDTSAGDDTPTTRSDRTQRDDRNDDNTGGRAFHGK